MPRSSCAAPFATCLLLAGCATSGAVDLAAVRATMKTALVDGERLLLANSCSRWSDVPVSLSQPVFGSCYLTDLRFIFEESAWAKALATAAKLVTTGGDFGLLEVAGAAAATFNAYAAIERGRAGELRVVARDGRLLVPLAAISGTSLAGERGDLVTVSPGGERWLTLHSATGALIFELYALPPDRTGLLPPLVGARWRAAIDERRRALAPPPRGTGAGAAAAQARLSARRQRPGR